MRGLPSLRTSLVRGGSSRKEEGVRPPKRGARGFPPLWKAKLSFLDFSQHAGFLWNSGGRTPLTWSCCLPSSQGLLLFLGGGKMDSPGKNESEPAGLGLGGLETPGHTVHTTSPEHTAHAEHSHSPGIVSGLRAVQSLGGVEWVEWAHEQHTGGSDKKPHTPPESSPSPENL